MFWGVLLPRSLRCSWQYSLNCEKKSSSIASGSTFTKLGALLKMSPCLEYWDALDFNLGYKLRAPCGVPLWYFTSILGKWWPYFLSSTNWQAAIYSSLVNWGVNWISSEVRVLNLFLAPRHLNLVENEPLLNLHDLVKKSSLLW